MIVVFHNNKKVLRVLSHDLQNVPFSKTDSIAAILLELAPIYAEEKIVWCHTNYETNLNIDFIENNQSYRNTIFSYNPTNNYFTNAIGYVESSPFITINKKVTYPTWQMSGLVGCVHASIFLQIKDSIKPIADFDYFLCSLAKTYMFTGLFCYSEPSLFLNANELQTIEVKKASIYTLFKFTKQHYKTRWIFLLFIDLVLYEKRVPFIALLLAFTNKKIASKKNHLASAPFLSHSGITSTDTVDVLIPTIGRKKTLYDVLQDLKNQTVLPKNIIIVEQNQDPNLGSELDYIYSESWPFVIKHTFTHQLGACNARNIALEQLESQWVFFADDDVRFNVDFIKDCLLNCKNYGKKAITLSCLQKGETIPNNNPIQWRSFGTCSSFVASEIVKKIRFDLRFEFGYSEDIDYGKKLRNAGTDVIFFTQPSVLHLKAPIGGFRTKFKFDWINEIIQPKPSPTVMLYKLLHCTKEELLGYKTTLGLKYYKNQNIRNPFAFWSFFNKQWNQSIYWANELIKRK